MRCFEHCFPRVGPAKRRSNRDSSHNESTTFVKPCPSKEPQYTIASPVGGELYSTMGTPPLPLPGIATAGSPSRLWRARHNLINLPLCHQVHIRGEVT